MLLTTRRMSQADMHSKNYMIVLVLNLSNDAILLLYVVVVVVVAAAAADDDIYDDDDKQDVTLQSSDRPGIIGTKSRPSSPINRLNRTASLIGLFCQWRLYDGTGTLPYFARN